MNNSKLIKNTILSPNNYGNRIYKVTRITPHCTAGLITTEALGVMFSKEETKASSNYGIGLNGDVGLYVSENKAACTSSNQDNDQRAITIECASTKFEPYEMSDTVYSKLVELCTDICRRYGKKSLIWFGDKKKTLAYIPKDDEMIITVHRWFSQKSCPGDWLYSRLGNLAKEVTEKLNVKSDKLYRVQVGAFSKYDNALDMVHKLKESGFDGFII